MAKLALRHCTPIKKGTTPISTTIASSLIKQLGSSWSFSKGATGLEQEFRFKNFHETMGFVNAVAWIANTEDHHPDLEVSYNRCKITFTTHAAGGLTVNDFICAAKVDAIYQSTLPEATAEKTQAIIEPPIMEPRPKTGTIPRPAPQAAEKTQAIVEPPRSKTGTTPRSAPQTTELNMDEAEELLNIEIRAPQLEAAPASAEDEIVLTDPDDEPTMPHLQGKSVYKTPTEPAGRNPESTMEYREESEEEHNQPEEHFRSTVILPPGMQNVSARKQDRDEEGTVIAQPEVRDETEFDVDEDEVRTMIMPGPQNTDETEERENSNMLKTVIIKPPLRGEDEDYAEPDETMLFDPKSGKKR
jgi:4a-hydroxytetrahydrobiopterin dehydratase